MSDEIQRAVQLLLEVLRGAGSRVAPKAHIEQSLSDRFSREVCLAAVQYALDSFLVDQVIDHLPNASDELEDHPIWFLKLLRPEETEQLRGLSRLDIAILQILRNANEPERLGQMREDVVRAKLTDEGFSYEDLRVLYVPDMVDTFRAVEDDGWVKWCYLIPEYEKTKEHKRREEESERAALERDALHTRMAEDAEKEDERREKKRALTREKRLKRQST